ncbi:hypothetical protein, partial [Micromonospora violae]|uniref:hypothetical protein n=1 Tax=Micromonospora violae TaxID=1278207 RepID=UPI0033C23775
MGDLADLVSANSDAVPTEVVSEIARSTALDRFGGVAVDVDVAPEGVDLPSEPLMAGPEGVSLLPAGSHGDGGAGDARRVPDTVLPSSSVSTGSEAGRARVVAAPAGSSFVQEVQGLQPTVDVPAGVGAGPGAVASPARGSGSTTGSTTSPGAGSTTSPTTGAGGGRRLGDARARSGFGHLPYAVGPHPLDTRAAARGERVGHGKAMFAKPIPGNPSDADVKREYPWLSTINTRLSWGNEEG